MGYEFEERTELRELSKNQLGLFTTDQALCVGLSHHHMRTDLRYGLIEAVYPSVFAVTGAGWTPPRRYLAASLAGGLDARTTHRPAAWLWGITRHEQRPEISLPTHRYISLKGVRVHRIADLPDEPVLRLGVPTTSVDRLLLDLGAVLPLGSVRDALDRAIAQRFATPMSVLAELNATAKRGRRGVGVMRLLLNQAGVTGSHAPSVLEAKTRRLIERAGLPQPECEYIAGENGEYRLDFVWPDIGLALEVEGWQYHSSYEAFSKGMTRQNSLTLRGLAFLRYSWMHVTREPDQVVRELRLAHRARSIAAVA